MIDPFDGLPTTDTPPELLIFRTDLEKAIYYCLAGVKDKNENYIYVNDIGMLIHRYHDTGYLTFTINYKDLTNEIIQDAIEHKYYDFIEASKRVVKYLLWEYDQDYVQQLLKKNNKEHYFIEFEKLVPFLSIRLKNYKYDLSIQDTVDTIPVRASKAAKLNKLESCRGVVISNTIATTDIVKTLMRCNDCGNEHTISFYEMDGVGSSGKCKDCEDGYFEMQDTEVNAVQYLMIQDLNDANSFETSTPVTLKCIVNQELTNKVEIGDSVIVTGLMRLETDNKDSKNMWRDKTKTNLDYYRNMQPFSPKVGGLSFPRIFEVNNIEVNNVDDFSNYGSMDEIEKLKKRPDLYELLIKSFCPQLKGLENVKEGALLTMIGGVGKNTTKKSNVKKRGNLRMMIIDDPSSGKSEIMKYCAGLLKRGIYVSATSSSKVGLTAAALKDEQTGQFIIAAGAILRANGSILTIDEISALPEDAVKALYEVAEQETYTMAKANILKTFNVDVVLIVGGNPREGRYNTDLSVYQNLSEIAAPFLTRFDLKYVMRDVPNVKKDSEIASWVMDQYNDDFEKHTVDLIPFDTLARYIAYVRNFGTEPKYTEEAMAYLNKRYVDKRQEAQGNDQVMQIVVREFEGILRIAAARARAVFSDIVDINIARHAMKLHDSMLVAIAPSDDDPNKADINKLYNKSMGQEDRNQMILTELKKMSHEQGTNKINRKVLEIKMVQKGMPINFFNIALKSLEAANELISDQIYITLI